MSDDHGDDRGDELALLTQLVAAFYRLPIEARGRVYRYLMARFPEQPRPLSFPDRIGHADV